MSTLESASALANWNEVSGEFLMLDSEKWYVIHHMDKMNPFLMSIVSSHDHWLFVSSTGGLTAGRVSPETALFPYITDDKLHDCTSHTGSKTVLRVRSQQWEPFNQAHEGRYDITRNLYKNFLGNKLLFEEINHTLQLRFRYVWMSSAQYGFVRQSELKNLSHEQVTVGVFDGLQNILPAGTPRHSQASTSNLVDAYKWAELDEVSGLAIFSLFSGISDRAEPLESLKATTVFSLGLNDPKLLLSSDQLQQYSAGQPIESERHKRGIRGEFFVNATLNIAPDNASSWQIVADVEQTQNEVIKLRKELINLPEISESIALSVKSGSDKLARIMASADSFQETEEQTLTAHHYANVLFNVLRGGVFEEQYLVPSRDFETTIASFNRKTYERQKGFLRSLPDTISYSALADAISELNDLQLERLCAEYLPISFGRRHGDPSRPWNEFAIKQENENGDPLLSYEGNWRDIFQNWEALVFSFPRFIENIIAKFVNASTIDGYNPYRISKEGIDWEVEDPDDPWSYIGYWGDHQIIYLQKLLELSRSFHPEALQKLLHQQIFSYANVPYRIKPFGALLDNPKQTVDYDAPLAALIEKRVAEIGADGKLLLNEDGDVYQVNLIEKLLLTLLSKLSNLVVDGGIWMNTQRPEWNDANNALVGNGTSMVTLFYMRRYVKLLQSLFTEISEPIVLSTEVRDWLEHTAKALKEIRPMLGQGLLSPNKRFESLCKLGQPASDYRERVYRQAGFSGKVEQPLNQVLAMFDDALVAIDHCIQTNMRQDGLYEAYNIMDYSKNEVSIDHLYPMLEGQVAALSSGAIGPEQAADLVDALFDSDIYRADQQTFMLYPNRPLPGFLDKNRISQADVNAIPIIGKMLREQNESLVTQDADGCYRFDSELTNIGELNTCIDAQLLRYGESMTQARKPLQSLYEKVFNHRAFTGRSGGMFGFEGLGSIYWHMVSKLLLAVQENFFHAVDAETQGSTCQRLGEQYYRIRQGIGFNKTPLEYGAFPVDPYSHTPAHAGARQPGMTGQVKEEILTRFGELGIRVSDGKVQFQPRLLRAREFLLKASQFRYLDVKDQWQEITVHTSALAFTWCQIPIIYQLAENASLVVTRFDETTKEQPSLTLSTEDTNDVASRNGRIIRITLTINKNMLFAS